MTGRLFRPGFVLEQTLGSATHGQNLRRLLSGEPNLAPEWLEIPFRPRGLLSRLPPISTNWSLRGSLSAYRALRATDWRSLDALFVHTLTVSLRATSVYERIPTVLSLDATPANFDSVGPHYQHRAQPRLVERIKARIVRRAVDRAQAFVAWSEWAKRSLVDDYGAAPERVTVLAPGAELGMFTSQQHRNGSQPARILFVGGDFVRKGGDLLLRVFRERFRGRAELHLVTSADVQPEEGVFVHRRIGPNSPELLELFQRADIFTLPTRADCLAVVLGEAMAASLPIVTTTVGAHPEAVEHERSGLLVPPDDAQALGDALDELVSVPALRVDMGERGRRIAEERFDAKRNALAILDLLREIA